MNTVRTTLANWRTAPFSRRAFQHVREIVPSADIPNDPFDEPGFALTLKLYDEIWKRLG